MSWPGILVGAFAGCWAMAWVAARALVVTAPMPHADAILVFSGGPAYRERILHAAKLYADGRAETIMLTDDGVKGPWSKVLQRNPFSIERGVLWLGTAGVPASHVVVLPGRVRSTHDEANAVLEYARTHGLRSLLAVTSRHHSRRALWTLQRVFRDTNTTVGLDVAPPLPPSPSDTTWWLSRRGWSLVAGEYVKMAWYRVHFT